MSSMALLQMEVAHGGSLVPEQPQGLKFQPLLNVRTSSLYLPIFEGIFTRLEAGQLILDTAPCSYPSICWSAPLRTL